MIVSRESLSGRRSYARRGFFGSALPRIMALLQSVNLRRPAALVIALMPGGSVRFAAGSQSVNERPNILITACVDCIAAWREQV